MNDIYGWSNPKNSHTEPKITNDWKGTLKIFRPPLTTGRCEATAALEGHPETLTSRAARKVGPWRWRLRSQIVPVLPMTLFEVKAKVKKSSSSEWEGKYIYLDVKRIHIEIRTVYSEIYSVSRCAGKVSRFVVWHFWKISRKSVKIGFRFHICTGAIFAIPIWFDGWWRLYRSATSCYQL